MDIIKSDLKDISFPVCIKCGVILTDKNWGSSRKEKHIYICKKCECEYSKKWQQNNRDKYNQSRRESNQRLKNEVIDAYGGKCACCGETRREYLTIDHKNGNGNKHRREIGATSSDGLYRWLKKNNYPEEFQVLCFNCNCGKGNYSICPHDKDAFEEEFEAKLKELEDARYAWALRMDIIKGYGGKCELCGEDNPHSLTIDHIDGINTEEEKRFRSGGALYRKLIDNNYPKDNYRLLCYNCNCALGCNRITEEEIIKDILVKEMLQEASMFSI